MTSDTKLEIGGYIMIVGSNAPDFTTNAYVKDEIKNVSLTDFRGKWVLLFFYSGDFTFV